MDLSKLNKEQKEAVETLEGPVLVLALAGTGKTTMLIHRLVNLIEHGVDPNRILLLTFTNKAANEMTARASLMLDDSCEKVNGTTYHSFCAEILRHHAPKIGFTPNFSICDSSDAAEMLNLIKEKNGYTKEMMLPDGKTLVDMFSYMINKEKTLTYVLENRYPKFVDQEKEISKIKEDYVLYKYSKNIFDYDDLLTQVINLFETYPEVCKSYSDYYQYIMVDEYQDSNLLQMQLLMLLRQFENKNVCVVGDPQQCLPEGTKIATPNGYKNIENIKENDEVIVASGRGKTNIGKVESIYKKKYTGDLIKITTSSGKVIQATPEHIAFLDTDFTNKYFVYLMYREGYGFRIGRSTVYNENTKIKRNGCRAKMQKEMADKLWLLGVYNTFEESIYYEQYYAYTYGIPLYVFNSDACAVRLTQEMIKKLFNDINTYERGKQLLKDLNLFEEYPHYMNQIKDNEKKPRSLRRIHVTMFGSKDVANQPNYKGNKHELCFDSIDEDIAERCKRFLGTNPSKKTNVNGTTYYNGRKVLSDIDTLCDISIQYKKELPKTYIINEAILTETPKRFSFMPFSNIKIGMKIGLLENGKIISDEVTNIETIVYNGYVYDLNVPYYRNYIANDMAVHNCIYGFRGSRHDNILNFPDQFEDCKIVKLEQNYRSNQEILDLANQYIDNEDERFQSELRGTHSAGYKPSLVYTNAQNDEALFVLNKIKQYKRDGVSLNDMAVIVRGSYDSNMLESLIMEQGTIPYQKFGGIKFFEREFVKNIFAYLKILTNYKDEISWFRVLKLYPGIGPVNAKKISEKILENGIEELTDSKYVKKNYAEYLVEIYDFFKAIEPMEFTDQMEYLVNEYYYKTVKRSIQNMKTTKSNITKKIRELDDDIEQAQVLIKIAENYKTASKFVNDIILEVPQPENIDEKLTVTTVHSAKGLEYKVVFMLGCVEGKFPWVKDVRAMTDEAVKELEEEMEEEQRIFYVAVTRAKENLYLMYPQYNIFTREKNTLSRFLSENNIFKDCCDIKRIY